jgi:hypothetical protein
MVTVPEPKKVVQTLEEVANHRAAVTEAISMGEFLRDTDHEEAAMELDAQTE